MGKDGQEQDTLMSTWQLSVVASTGPDNEGGSWCLNLALSAREPVMLRCWAGEHLG